MQYLYGFGLIALGFIIIRYSKWIVDSTGIRFGALVSFLGSGQEYNVWKILGIISLIGGIYFIFNGLPF